MFEYLSIPTLTTVLYIIELFSLIYYLILWKDTQSKTALHFSFVTIYMILVNITGLTYSKTDNPVVWKIYLCILSVLWPYVAYSVSTFSNPDSRPKKFVILAGFFFVFSLLNVTFLDSDITALQGSAISMFICLSFASWVLIRLDGTIYRYGRMIGAVILFVYAVAGVMRALSASMDISWEQHFYYDQRGMQSLYFLASVIFASLMPITIYALHTEKSSDVMKKNALQLEEEKEKLQASLEEVKTLRGIIPICMHCKKIRNDDGYWEDVAVYIQEHSYADMSHGLCPDCLKEKYPSVYDKLVKDGRLKE